MSNLSIYSNIYTNLSQSAYQKRPFNFPSKQENFVKNQSVVIDYSKKGNGDSLPNNGKVYLQPDPTVKTIKEQRTIPFSTTETPQTYTYSYQKGLLTDEKAA
jgi:hypothetical protein